MKRLPLKHVRSVVACPTCCFAPLCPPRPVTCRSVGTSAFSSSCDCNSKATLQHCTRRRQLSPPSLLQPVRGTRIPSPKEHLRSKRSSSRICASSVWRTQLRHLSPKPQSTSTPCVPLRQPTNPQHTRRGRRRTWRRSSIRRHDTCLT